MKITLSTILFCSALMCLTASEPGGSNDSNENQVTVRKSPCGMGNSKGVKTSIGTPYLREERIQSEDGKVNLRVVTATIRENDQERVTQSIFFDGELIREVSVASLDKHSNALTEKKYAPDGTFIMQRTNEDPWCNQLGEPLSFDQQLTAQKQEVEKQVNLKSIKVTPTE